ncbi:MAG: hypothetical protein KIT61_13075 [Pyrinomonadaceae bacterium]|nr:hypothetical protein [Blastocatellia bacterium]MCW5957510.1 hypothetical protein [Pyrinomonadaceae bacterium]
MRSIIMNEPDEISELLREIRDIQTEHLSEYKRVTQRSLELQERAVERQEKIGRLYVRVILASAILVLGIIVVIIYVISLLPRRY